MLKDYYRKRGYLGSKDRRYISECYYGILRNQALVERYAAQSLGSGGSWPQIPAIALVTAFLTRIAHDDATTLRADVAGLWNRTVRDPELDTFFSALLTAALPEGETPAARIAAEFSFPHFIVSEWVELYGEEEAAALCRTLNDPAPVTIRVNALRCTREECRDALAREGVDTTPTSLSPVGLMLSKRVNVNELRTFRDGWFEMQDEGSQLISMLVEPKPGALVVDACAGGGGKTLHLAAIMSNHGTLVSLDVDQERLAGIGPRLVRAGVTIADVLHAERDRGRLDPLKSSANAVLVDAPCSGVGTFRRNPGAKMLVTPEAVGALTRTQAAILDAAAEYVMPGGRLVYSTCTLLHAENQDQVTSFLSRHADFVLGDAPAILRRQGVEPLPDGPMLVLFPRQSGTDGFFAAVMERRS